MNGTWSGRPEFTSQSEIEQAMREENNVTDAQKPTELLPCPFCAGDARQQENGRSDSSYYECCCDKCDFCGPAFNTPEEAVSAWNTRAILSASQTQCSCEKCAPPNPFRSRMYVCSICGNKRCPHAADHRNACTSNNEPGQDGSSYPAPQGMRSDRITVREANEILQRMINSHFNSDGEHMRASIPANPERDDDLRMQRFINQQADALASVAGDGMTDKTERLRETLKGVIRVAAGLIDNPQPEAK